MLTTTGPVAITLNANPLLSTGIKSATMAGPSRTNPMPAKPIIALNTINTGRFSLAPQTANEIMKMTYAGNTT